MSAITIGIVAMVSIANVSISSASTFVASILLSFCAISVVSVNMVLAVDSIVLAATFCSVLIASTLSPLSTIEAKASASSALSDVSVILAIASTSVLLPLAVLLLVTELSTGGSSSIDCSIIGCCITGFSVAMTLAISAVNGALVTSSIAVVIGVTAPVLVLALMLSVFDKAAFSSSSSTVVPLVMAFSMTLLVTFNAASATSCSFFIAASAIAACAIARVALLDVIDVESESESDFVSDIASILLLAVRFSGVSDSFVSVALVSVTPVSETGAASVRFCSAIIISSSACTTLSLFAV